MANQNRAERRKSFSISPSCRFLTKKGNSVSHQSSQLTEDTEEEDEDKEERGEGWKKGRGNIQAREEEKVKPEV